MKHKLFFVLISLFFLFFFGISLTPSFAGSQPDASNSSISINPSSAPGDGQSVITIIITLKDTAGTALINDTAHLSISNNVAISPSSAVLDASGKATFSVTSSSSNTYNVNVVDDSTSTTLVNFGQITFSYSPYSAPGCGDSKPVSAPKLTSALVTGSNQIKLTWAKALDPVSYYLVAYGLTSGQYQYGNPNVGGRDTTSYTVGGLQNGVTYYFVVRAVNGCAPGDFSNELSANVSLVKPTAVAITTPTMTLSPTEATNSINNNVLQDTSMPTPTDSPEPQTSEPYQPASKEPAPAINYIVLIPVILVVVFGALGIVRYLKKKKNRNGKQVRF